MRATRSAAGDAVLFLSVGATFFLRGRQVGSADFLDPVTLNDWLAVFGFSVALMCLAAALPAYARLAGDRTTYRTSWVPATGAALGGISNVLEDGLSWDWAFWFFVTGALILSVGLVALTVVMVWGGRGVGRLLAAVPAGTLVGVLLFEPSGGVILLVTWGVAAVVALRWPRPVAGAPAAGRA